MMIMKTEYIRFDWAIKRMLRNKADTSVLEGFLSVLLEKDIKIIDFLESESNQNTAESKFNRVDIICNDDKDDVVIIEIQNAQSADYFHRMLYGTSKAIAERMKLGFDYSTVKKIYSINIVYFDLGQGEDYLYHGKTEYRGMHKGDLLQLSPKQKDAFSVQSVHEIFPEYYIIKVNDFDSVATTPLDEWISFLKTGEIPDSYTAKGLKEAREQLRYDSLTPQEKEEYRRVMDSIRYDQSVVENTYSIGKAEGKAEGKADEQKRMVLNMKKYGMSIELIAQVTGLTKEEIESLK